MRKARGLERKKGSQKKIGGERRVSKMLCRMICKTLDSTCVVVFNRLYVSLSSLPYLCYSTAATTAASRKKRLPN